MTTDGLTAFHAVELESRTNGNSDDGVDIYEVGEHSFNGSGNGMESSAIGAGAVRTSAHSHTR